MFCPFVFDTKNRVCVCMYIYICIDFNSIVAFGFLFSTLSFAFWRMSLCPMYENSTQSHCISVCFFIQLIVERVGFCVNLWRMTLYRRQISLLPDQDVNKSQLWEAVFWVETRTHLVPQWVALFPMCFLIARYGTGFDFSVNVQYCKQLKQMVNSSLPVGRLGICKFRLRVSF